MFTIHIMSDISTFFYCPPLFYCFKQVFKMSDLFNKKENPFSVNFVASVLTLSYRLSLRSLAMHGRFLWCEWKLCYALDTPYTQVGVITPLKGKVVASLHVFCLLFSPRARRRRSLASPSLSLRLRSSPRSRRRRPRSREREVESPIFLSW